jgi:SAM-dependent methyltransferase
MNQKLQNEIEQIFREAERIWDSQKYGDLKQLWDHKDPDPFYLAEEQADWRIGWDSLSNYWEPIPGQRMIEAIRMRFYDIKIKELSPEYVFAVGCVRHDMKIRGPMKAWGGDARISALFRRTKEGWKFITYAESHKSPVMYMQELYDTWPKIPIIHSITKRFLMKLYQRNTHPKFEAFHRRIMDDENKVYKVSIKRRLSFVMPILSNLYSKLRGKKAIPKAYIPGLIPCLNGRGFMEEDLNDISKSFVEDSSTMNGLSLDVGCAYGIASIAALKKGANILAADMDQGHLDILLQETPEDLKPNLKTKKGTLPNIDFENKSFISIHCSRCLHFLKPDELIETLTNMYHWLKPGGRVYLITDTCYSGPWKNYLPEFEKKLEAGDPFPGFIDNVLDCLPVTRLPKGMTPHMNCLDPDTLARECKAAGFEIITAKFFGPARASSNYGKDHAGIIAVKN